MLERKPTAVAAYHESNGLKEIANKLGIPFETSRKRYLSLGPGLLYNEVARPDCMRRMGCEGFRGALAELPGQTLGFVVSRIVDETWLHFEVEAPLPGQILEVGTGRPTEGTFGETS